MKCWTVQIMINRPNGVLYVDVTDNLDERVKEHKLKLYPRSFTAKYNCDKLVYFEEFDDGQEAVKRERQMKKWKRVWKVKLIENFNPNWVDISLNWKLNYNKSR
ncbi:GIY-YIG nuclease family protein [Allomuricauda sp. CP2A]|uniref:GIY-YIG nuclease family protein n=1 Tax=Allomuricauda sp. CP2A TaxID=1848189 RepID=UPI0008313954|nr:GIY-YIG nuclease family protein [Muricauda sp. CP2A]